MSTTLTLHEVDRQLELVVVQARLLVDEEEIVVALRRNDFNWRGVTFKNVVPTQVS